jgi:hypothetical protein
MKFTHIAFEILKPWLKALEEFDVFCSHCSFSENGSLSGCQMQQWMRSLFDKLM